MPRPKKEANPTALCSKCCKEQEYIEKEIKINYGFNDKEHVLIDGIERICSVCGWPVNNIETTKINHDIAIKALNKPKAEEKEEAQGE